MTKKIKFQVAIFVALIFHKASLIQPNPVILRAPRSRIVSRGTSANFTCAVQNPIHPFWRVNDIEFSELQNETFRSMGLFVHPIERRMDGAEILTMTVNSSFRGTNNTSIFCHDILSVTSNLAYIYVINGKYSIV